MSDTTDTLIPQSSPAIPSYKLPKKLIFAVAALLFIGLILGLTLGFLLPVGNENLCHPSKFGDFPNDPLERAKKVLTVCPLVDTHNDLPWTLRGDFKDRVWDADLNTNLPGFHTSIPLLKEGHVGGQIWSVYVGCGYV